MAMYALPLRIQMKRLIGYTPKCNGSSIDPTSDSQKCEFVRKRPYPLLHTIQKVKILLRVTSMGRLSQHSAFRRSALIIILDNLP